MLNNKLKKTISLLCVIGTFSAVLQNGGTAQARFSSSYLDTESVEITIDVTDTGRSISPYIYGINAESDISGVTVNALKQTDPRVSSYNWETNLSNTATGNVSANDEGLIGTYPPGRWGDPALYTEYLLTKAKRYNVPSRYVTLQMTNAVAAESPDNLLRWNDVFFSKADSYLSVPNTNDGAVYVDEYISYLVNRYGYAVDGGVNGYFLDNEPENWSELFPAAVAERITAEELVERSARLSSAVKKIDPTALVYGPSISGIEAFIRLKNQADWEQYSRDYSWFIDYYLMEMNEASRTAGTRLLDVLDLHYHTEATNGLLTPIIDGTDAFSHNTRLQAPRIFWDSTYTENSNIAILHNQHIPLIPTLEASINMYYPGTKLSFSEYNFGAGDHITGGIATADTLGIFAKYGVHMACLKPDTENIDFHKAAINIYTNYDGMGSRFGTTIVEADNDGDYMSSVYSAIDGNDTTTMRTVLINKNSTGSKTAAIEIKSDVMYENVEIYSFSSEGADIVLLEDEPSIEDNFLEFELEPLSVYMIVFSSETIETGDDNGSEIIDTPVAVETDIVPADTEKTTEPVITTASESVQTTAPEHVSAETLSSAGTTVIIDGNLPDEEGYSADVTTAEGDDTGIAEESETTYIDITEKESQVPKPVKVIVCALLGLVLLAMLYVFFSNNKKPDR